MGRCLLGLPVMDFTFLEKFGAVMWSNLRFVFSFILFFITTLILKLEGWYFLAMYFSFLVKWILMMLLMITLMNNDGDINDNVKDNFIN